MVAESGTGATATTATGADSGFAYVHLIIFGKGSIFIGRVVAFLLTWEVVAGTLRTTYSS